MLLDELFVAMFDQAVFCFRSICASKGDIFATSCGVILGLFAVLTFPMLL